MGILGELWALSDPFRAIRAARAYPEDMVIWIVEAIMRESGIDLDPSLVRWIVEGSVPNLDASSFDTFDGVANIAGAAADRLGIAGPQLSGCQTVH